MFQQFVRLVLGCCAVVARGGHRHVAGHLDALHCVDALEHCVGDVGGVGAFALGHGDGDSRILLRRLMRGRRRGAEEDVVGRLRRAVHDLVGHIAQIHGTAVIDRHHHGFKVFAAGEEIAGVHADFVVVLVKAAHLQACVRSL